MFAKYTIAAVAGSALLASAALAQSPTATTDRADTNAATTSTASSTSFQGDWRASKVVGLSVYNDNNESVGSINDLLTDKTGSIKAVVIGVGGFLGVGEHLVAVPFDKVKFVNEPVAFTGVAGAPNAGGGAKPPTTTGAATTTSPPATTTSSPAPSAGPTTSTAKQNPWYPDHAVFNATKDELKAMAQFNYTTN